MSGTGAAPAPSTDNTTLMMIDVCRKLDRLDERTLNTQQDVQELKGAFELHRSATEARSNRIGERLSFLKGEWKAWVAIGLVILQHFWPKTT